MRYCWCLYNSNRRKKDETGDPATGSVMKGESNTNFSQDVIWSQRRLPGNVHRRISNSSQQPRGILRPQGTPRHRIRSTARCVDARIDRRWRRAYLIFEEAHLRQQEEEEDYLNSLFCFFFAFISFFKLLFWFDAPHFWIYPSYLTPITFIFTPNTTHF